jgi:Protein of unknown function (DUF1552)
MFVTKRALSRRTMLKGVGTTLALPFLESMVPSFTALAQTPANPPRRFGAVYFPNGAPMNGSTNYWMPKTTSGDLEITPILKPLEPFRDRMTVVGNLSRAGGKTVTDHAVSSAGWLSGVVAKQTEAEDISLGITIDQVLAAQVGQDTPFPSLEFATEDFSGYVGGCVPGYSCTYMNTISWAGPTSPLPMEINPRVAFERMFGRAGDASQRIARMRENRSILDSIADEARRLQHRLGPQDRARLDEYMGTVREIERRIEKTENRNASSVTSVAAPIGIPEAFEDHAALMFDLLAVAYQADLTRVSTFMMAREASQRTYPVLAIPETHHDVSHHGNQPEKMALHAKIDAHFATLFAAFLDKLRNSPDGDGSLLDHSLIVFGAGMSDGQAHSAYPLPLAAIGGSGQRLRGNRFLVANEWTPVANFWLGVAGLFGSTLDRFGESTGRVEL